MAKRRFTSIRATVVDKLRVAGGVPSTAEKASDSQPLARRRSVQRAEYNRRRESLRKLLQRQSSSVHQLHSDTGEPCTDELSGTLGWFQKSWAKGERRKGDSHLVVLVHGLQGSPQDLIGWKSRLQILLPHSNLRFLLSEANQLETWSNLETMAENLLDEVLSFVRAIMPQRIS